MITDALEAELGGAANSFISQATRAGTVQHERLLGILQRNASSPYGRSHAFSKIRSISEFQDRVPLKTYDELAPELKVDPSSGIFSACAQAAHSVVWSSGSTAPAKSIPITEMLVEEFEAAIRPWLDDLLTHYQLRGGSAYWVVAPRVVRSNYDRTGNEDFSYLSVRLSKTLAQVMVGADVAIGTQFDDWASGTLRVLLGRSDLAWLSFWSPSLLVRLLETIDEPQRESTFRRAWPNLRLVSCWADGWARLYLPRLRELLPWVSIQGKGLLSTEAVTSIPLSVIGDGLGVLAYRSHFYELLDPQKGKCVVACDATVQAEYEVVVTTGAGLYRYRTGDMVRVDGFLGEAPCLRFLGRANDQSDINGEKLSAGFVENIFEELQSMRGIDFSGAYLSAEVRPTMSNYVLHISKPTSLPESELAGLIDEALGRNPHYEYCRRMNQLGPLQVKSEIPSAQVASTTKQPVLRVPPVYGPRSAGQYN